MIRPLDWRRLSRSESTEPWWQRLSFEARDWAYARLQWGIEDDPRIADFLAGMLIGYRQEIPVDIEQDFRVTGTLHVFAISGQNIAEMAVVAIILLQLCGLVRWRWAWLLAPVVLIYCLLAGSPASAVRATVMALAILLAWRLGRPLNALGCWSIAVLAMLAWDPRVLLDPGAQLSFGVVLGLILLSPPIYRVIAARFQHDSFLPAKLMTAGQRCEEVVWSRAAALLAASIAATLASEPITALDFHQVTPISIVANLLVVPLAGLITVVGTISVTFSLVSYNLAALCNNANWLLARIMIAIVSFFAHEPGAAINVPDLRAAEQPSPLFVAAPLQDSACLLIKNGSHAWLIDTGATQHIRQRRRAADCTPVPYAPPGGSRAGQPLAAGTGDSRYREGNGRDDRALRTRRLARPRPRPARRRARTGAGQPGLARRRPRSRPALSFRQRHPAVGRATRRDRAERTDECLSRTARRCRPAERGHHAG
jgi:ComEC/Rec2-related protein